MYGNGNVGHPLKFYIHIRLLPLLHTIYIQKH